MDAQRVGSGRGAIAEIEAPTGFPPVGAFECGAASCVRAAQAGLLPRRPRLRGWSALGCPPWLRAATACWCAALRWSGGCGGPQARLPPVHRLAPRGARRSSVVLALLVGRGGMHADRLYRRRHQPYPARGLRAVGIHVTHARDASYIQRHGRPIAFYSDRRHFPVNNREAAGGDGRRNSVGRCTSSTSTSFARTAAVEGPRPAHIRDACRIGSRKSCGSPGSRTRRSRSFLPGPSPTAPASRRRAPTRPTAPSRKLAGCGHVRLEGGAHADEQSDGQYDKGCSARAQRDHAPPRPPARTTSITRRRIAIRHKGRDRRQPPTSYRKSIRRRSSNSGSRSCLHRRAAAGQTEGAQSAAAAGQAERHFKVSIFKVG